MITRERATYLLHKRWERRLPLVPLKTAIKRAKRLSVKKLRKQLAAIEETKKVSQKTMMTQVDV